MSQKKKTDENEKSIQEADRLLPINNVVKLMRDHLPDGCKISSDVKDRMNECVTELIGFVCNQASEEHMFPKKAKILQPQEILTSLDELDLGLYTKALELYCQKCLNINNSANNNN